MGPGTPGLTETGVKGGISELLKEFVFAVDTSGGPGASGDPDTSGGPPPSGGSDASGGWSTASGGTRTSRRGGRPRER